MVEILAGEGIENAFMELGIEAYCHYKNHKMDMAVWEIPESDYQRMLEVPNTRWRPKWGWWRAAKHSIQMSPIAEMVINGENIEAWQNEKINHSEDIIEYNSLLEYFADEWGITDETPVMALATDLAALNYMKVSELFTKYQGGESL